MKLATVTTSIIMSSIMTAHAGFQSWTVDADDDPFKGGQVVSSQYIISERSIVVIECNSNSGSVILKAIVGWAYNPQLAQVTPEVRYAIDGEVIALKGASSTGAFGDNIAGIVVNFDKAEGRKLVEAFSRSKKQIAISDGISDSPLLLSSKGSTSAGKKMLACIDKITTPDEIPAENTVKTAESVNSDPNTKETDKYSTETVVEDKANVPSSSSTDGSTKPGKPSSLNLRTPEGVGYTMTAFTACFEGHDYASRQVKATVNATFANHMTNDFASYQRGQEEFNVVAAEDIDKACAQAVDRGGLKVR